jgi:pimeloyl-ACP methyl ester carboxylesterase
MSGDTTYVIDEGNADGELVLHLHGGFSESTPLHALLLPRLGDRYRVAAFDRRGHGQTPDTDEPFHYSSMADEAIEVLEHLDGGPAHVVGYSDGGGVALWLATKRPDRVRSMVLIGAGFHHTALREDWIDPNDPIMQTPYAVKAAAMYTAEPTFTVDDLATMAMPVLVLVGDDDCFDLSHTVAMYEALPNAQLAVVPGASHLCVIEKGPLVAQLIDDFLTSRGEVSTILPVRRRDA